MFLKNFVTGKYSLPMTFWGGFCLMVSLSVFKYLAVYNSLPYLIPIRFLLQSIILLMMIPGIFFILKRNKTFLGIAALVISLLYLFVSVYMLTNLFNLFYI